jgi:hypothetical protein
MKHGTLALDAAGASYGLEASGGSGGGFFRDNNGTGRAYVARSHVGIDASGSEGGGYFEDNDGTSLAHAAIGDIGLEGRGAQAGGSFQDLDDSGSALVGKPNLGIEARGNLAGGYFLDDSGLGYAYVGAGDYGIDAFGEFTAGRFTDLDDSGTAYVGYGHTGVRGLGEGSGGFFRDSDGSGFVYAGKGDYGLEAGGDLAGAYLRDNDSTGEAWVGYSNYGIYASGSSSGGYFEDSDASGFARVAYGDRGIWARGTFAGGTFSHPDGVTFWADVARSNGYKIRGTGVVSFVQNHPYQKDRVIVYAAPEGDEVAVYTRGTARLDGGQARVSLGETFRWVANPDIGLTAHLTPRGAEPLALTVRTLSTSELVVLGPVGSDARFDYLVYGLRLGFEELGILREKERDAFPPADDVIQSAYREHPELRAHNALERFREMSLAAGEPPADGMPGARAILAALEKQRDGARQQAALSELEARKSAPHAAMGDAGTASESTGASPSAAEGGSSLATSRGSTIPLPSDGRAGVGGTSDVHARSFRPSAAELATLVEVSEPVETGDVLVIDTASSGEMSLARTAEDTRLFGVVAGAAGIVLGESAPRPSCGERPTAVEARTCEDPLVESRSPSGNGGPVRAPVVFSGVALCKVDAGYGSVRPGDLLTSSPTPGHAMRAHDPRPGTVVAKALEPLEAGTGLVRVLVMLR